MGGGGGRVRLRTLAHAAPCSSSKALPRAVFRTSRDSKRVARVSQRAEQGDSLVPEGLQGRHGHVRLEGPPVGIGRLAQLTDERRTQGGLRQQAGSSKGVPLLESLDAAPKVNRGDRLRITDATEIHLRN
eukprot:3700376-Alexandrium_andersonii.AAC.1